MPFLDFQLGALVAPRSFANLTWPYLKMRNSRPANAALRAFPHKFVVYQANPSGGDYFSNPFVGQYRQLRLA